MTILVGILMMIVPTKRVVIYLAYINDEFRLLDERRITGSHNIEDGR